MRRVWAVCAFMVIGVALVTAGCSDDAGPASDGGPSTIAEGGHAGHTSGTEATTSTGAAPERLAIVATEYEWSGLPDQIPAGTYPMSFRNDGAEAHEIALFRNPDDVPLEELFELGPVGIKDAVDMVGTLISGPGLPADQELTVTLTPGEYEVVCFIPAADGRPHFERGMHRTLEVL